MTCASSVRYASQKGDCQRTPPTRVPDFNDPTVFRDKSTWFLIKALAILKLCSFDYLAKNSVQIMKQVEKVAGSYLVYDLAVKRTIYAYFCAGENEAELRNTVKSLSKRGVGSVLDYAAEADTEGFTPEPGMEEAPIISMSQVVNKCDVKYLADGTLFDDNMKLYMMSIMHASLNHPLYGPGQIAVKVSGMCNPQLLARINAILMSIHQSWVIHFTQEEQNLRIEECRVVMGINHKHRLHITREQLKEGFARRNPNKPIDTDLYNQLVELMDPEKTGKISYYRYKQVLTDAVVAVDPTPVQMKAAAYLPVVSDREKKLWKDVNERLELIAATGSAMSVRCMVDAEQTFYQLAIDAIVMNLQKKFNKEAPVVYNTYQCYLTYAEDRVSNDLDRAKEYGFQWGGKIVRGAYMIQERKTAQEYNYTSPIWPDLEGTAACYQNTVKRAFKAMSEVPNNKYEIFCGTHNAVAVRELAQLIIDTPTIQSRCAFGQLYGMRDNLTFPLAQGGVPGVQVPPLRPREGDDPLPRPPCRGELRHPLQRGGWGRGSHEEGTVPPLRHHLPAKVQ
ncbi:proline oxidase, mitochondrial precursor-like protein [Angomonas deanei]|nr:proline oxidase, mitochondrial precursor-like protein [Angomonas deanei]|eukprot:EPY38189.1 proline oxidase, mitochondrial precursor-like protein [Angomonas deanei]